jgi:hypothetical protein
MKGMMLTRSSQAAVVGLLVLGLCGPGVGGIQVASAQDPKAATPEPPPIVSPAQASGAGLPPANGPKSPGAAEEAPAPGTVFAVLRVTDSGTRVRRQERQVIARLPGRTAETIAASPGCAVLGVKLPRPKDSALESVQVIVTGDRRAVELTADRVAGSGCDTKEARPSPLEIPLTVIEERAREVRGPTQTLTAGSVVGVGWDVVTRYPLPPIPGGLVRPKRRIDVDIRLAGQGGQSTLLLSEVDIKLPWRGDLPTPPGSIAGQYFVVSQDRDQLIVVQAWGFH